LVVAQVRWPTVGGVETLVREVEPRRADVVEAGEGSLGEMVRTVFVFGDGARVADGADEE
jgi:hypothetical protein